MAYIDFLRAFAHLQGLPNEQMLLDAPDTYKVPIASRTRARDLIAELAPALGAKWKGLKVLDVGCGYGALAVELANQGARVVGIDTSAKWLKLAEENARDEGNATFVKADAGSREVVGLINGEGPFGAIVLKDVLQHIADPAALFGNLVRLAAPRAKIYYRIPNGRSLRYVLADPLKQIFGITLLPNENWRLFDGAPSGVYYRRWELYRALAEGFGFTIADATKNVDLDEAYTRRHVEFGLRKVKRRLRPENFASHDQLAMLRTAYRAYAAEVEDDLTRLSWNQLYRKYRAANWEGVLTLSADASARAAAE